MRVKRLVVMSIALVAGCKSPTPSEQVDSIQSWLGTAEMVGDAWLRHSTPDKYSRQTLELSHQTLLRISGDLLRSRPRSVDFATLDGVLSGSGRHISRMAHLIAVKNAPDFALQLDSLRTNDKIVKQLSDRIKLTR
jgi:hypothetical protein